MKHSIIAAVLLTMCLGCSYNKNEKDKTEQIDSTVVGKDTNSADVRRDIDLSDENKRVLPDEASEPTKSDKSAEKPH